MPNGQESTVPHLITAQNGPILALERVILDNQDKIEGWLRAEWRKTPAPFYTSVDLRNAGFKLAPVDTNLYPAGFNNLNPSFMPLCINAVQAAVERNCAEASGVLFIPENHTRNFFYLESVATLVDIIRRAGFRVRIGSLIPDLKEPTQIDLPSGRSVLLEPITRNGNKISVEDFTPCSILLNNDLSGGRPPLLEGLDQPVIPPLNLGWFNRLKSAHFAHYRRVSFEVAELLNIDPWLIDPMFRSCGEINLKIREGEECIAKNADALLTDIRRKYKEYGVDKEPFVIVKADAGTYGMGIMTVRDPQEVFELNRKERVKMSATKEGQAITKVLVQEGVYTFETWGGDNAVAEPVVYMIDRYVVGGFYRVHKNKGVDENLNAPGMHFEPLAFATPPNVPDKTMSPDASPNRFYAYGVVARLAMLAAAREIAEAKK